MVTRGGFTERAQECLFENTVVPLIRPPDLARNCGHIREVAVGEREK